MRGCLAALIAVVFATMACASIHGSATYLGFVATRTATPHRQNLAINSMTTRTAHVARDNITQLKLLSGNWFVCEDVINGSCATQYAEQGSGASQTRTAVFEYPAGTYHRVTWGGSSSVTEANGATDIVSDWIAVTIPKGAAFWTQEYVSNSAGIIYLSQVGNNEFSTTLGDKTVLGGSDATGTNFSDGGAFGAAGGYGMFPYGILAMTSNAAVLIIGTSRTEGIFDTVDSSGDLGIIARSVGQYWGYVNGGVTGQSLANFNSSHSKRATLGKYSSQVIFEGPTNDDLSAGLPSLEATMQSAWAVYPSEKVYSTTCDPDTSSTDEWETTANQTVSKNFSGVNGYIDGVPSPILGAYDIATVTASQVAGKWNGDGSTPQLWTWDGTHETQHANLAIESSGVIPAGGYIR